jgi:hypothetical protein
LNSTFNLERMQRALEIDARLHRREKRPAAELKVALDVRALSLSALSRPRAHPWTPLCSQDKLCPGTFFLQNVQPSGVRAYTRKPLTAEFVLHEPVATLAAVLGHETQSQAPEQFDSAVSVVVTGVAAGLPGCEDVFAKDNLSKLVNGLNCIDVLSMEIKHSMLEKNVVQMRKRADGSFERAAVKHEGESIQLAAQLRPVDLSKYGVAESIAATMVRYSNHIHT